MVIRSRGNRTGRVGSSVSLEADIVITLVNNIVTTRVNTGSRTPCGCDKRHGRNYSSVSRNRSASSNGQLKCVGKITPSNGGTHSHSFSDYRGSLINVNSPGTDSLGARIQKGISISASYLHLP